MLVGIVITLSVLVAAGIAVYESPQIQEWLQSSRRKIALALNSWGDELESRRSGRRDDISMTEELGEEAELRRRRIREEIRRRRELLDSYNRQRISISSGSFNTLVDSEGRLKAPAKIDNVESASTGVEITDSETTSRFLHRTSDFPPSLSNADAKIDTEQNRVLLEDINRARLNIPPLSELSSNHPSESLVDLTPTSEFPDSELAFSLLSRSEHSRAPAAERASVPSSTAASHTEDDFDYMHADNLDESPVYHDHSAPNGVAQTIWAANTSSAASVASSLSHIQNETFDITSDGTLSDLGRDRENMYTPVSWSEVSSVTSSNDQHQI